MYSYASRVPVSDRWAIAAYIRVLQRTRPVVSEDVYETERVRARERTGIPNPAPPPGEAAPGQGAPGQPPTEQRATPGLEGPGGPGTPRPGGTSMPGQTEH